LPACLVPTGIDPATDSPLCHAKAERRMTER